MSSSNIGEITIEEALQVIKNKIEDPWNCQIKVKIEKPNKNDRIKTTSVCIYQHQYIDPDTFEKEEEWDHHYLTFDIIQNEENKNDQRE